MTRFKQYADALTAAIEEVAVPMEGGPLDGIPMLSLGLAKEAIAAVPIPPIEQHEAELATPATVYLDAKCHICGESGLVTVTIESKTTVDNKHRTLAAKVDAGSVVHVCGQVALPRNVTEVEGQQEVGWDIGDITGGATLEPGDLHEEDGSGGEAPDPTVCPHPGCNLPAEHSGDHEFDPARGPKPDAPPKKGRGRRKTTSTPDSDADGTGEGHPLPEPGETADDDLLPD